MSNPKKLKIGDWIKYVERPLEWKTKKYRVDTWDIEFLDKLIARGRWQRISEIDEYGNPWIHVRIKYDAKCEHHSWAMFESSGWILKSAQQGDAPGRRLTLFLLRKRPFRRPGKESLTL